MAPGGVRPHVRNTAEALAKLDNSVHTAIANRVFPGASVACGQTGSGRLHGFTKGYGTHTYESSVPTTSETVFDVASLTKVVATLPAVMVLYDAGKIDLEAPVCQYIPEFAQNGKEAVTVKHLLTHTSGLHVFYPFYFMGLTTQEAIFDFICSDSLRYPVGETHYSDLSMMIIGLLVERVTNRPLDRFVSHAVFRRIGMRSTGYRRKQFMEADVGIPPTEVDRTFRNRLLWGEVHDPNAFLLDGVAGHAGLFSCVNDLCKFCHTMLSGGVTPGGDRVFKASTVAKFTRPGSNGTRALGWDVRPPAGSKSYTSSGTRMSSKAYGHTGFTGTSMWLDPDHQLFTILLSNAVHPWAEAKTVDGIREVRAEVADALVDVVAAGASPFIRPLKSTDRGRSASAGKSHNPEDPLSPMLPLIPEAAGPCGLLSCSTVTCHVGDPAAAQGSPAWDPAAAPQLQHYVVQPGDRAVRLARERGMTMQDFEHLNPGVDPSAIRSGSRLWLLTTTRAPPAAILREETRVAEPQGEVDGATSLPLNSEEEAPGSVHQAVAVDSPGGDRGGGPGEWSAPLQEAGELHETPNGECNDQTAELQSRQALAEALEDAQADNAAGSRAGSSIAGQAAAEAGEGGATGSGAEGASDEVWEPGVGSDAGSEVCAAGDVGTSSGRASETRSACSSGNPRDSNVGANGPGAETKRRVCACPVCSRKHGGSGGVGGLREAERRGLSSSGRGSEMRDPLRTSDSGAGSGARGGGTPGDAGQATCRQAARQHFRMSEGSAPDWACTEGRSVIGEGVYGMYESFDATGLAEGHIEEMDGEDWLKFIDIGAHAAQDAVQSWRQGNWLRARWIQEMPWESEKSLTKHDSKKQRSTVFPMAAFLFVLSWVIAS
ncbi:hypothetical protein CYMTET_49365 [Cymbomonas tetramitiformis]|uniref:LysM domain-containing protein n=1 Tax=Cymbomonas tetramitiformis TaxID=36881 RepID=A0AAE0BSA9_9CHLO|nr:hypothetical protein CYMTET_49365 [Cymbomonas tetramitiformis]